MSKSWQTSMMLGDRAARHVARFQRAQARALLKAMLRGGRRQEVSQPLAERLVGLEPIAAATLRDAQLHGYLRGAVNVAGMLPDAERAGWGNRPALGSIGSGRSPGGPVGLNPVIPGGGGGGRGGSGPSSGPPDPEKPAIHFPQIDRGHEFIAGLTPLLPQDFEAASIQARRTAFTVARAQTLAAVEAVQDAVARDIRDGGTLESFRDVVDEALDHALSDAETQTLYRTYVGRAYSAGQVAVLDDPGVRSSVPYLLYSATHDSRVRKSHLALERMGLDGTNIYRADDPFWDFFYPPWAWNCRCLVIPLNVALAAERGVREAKEWLRTGRPPINPQFVTMPNFRPPAGWIPSGRSLSIAW